MRSDKIYRALAGGMSRYAVCQMVAKGVRATHKSGSRYEDSINYVLEFLSHHNEPVPSPTAAVLPPAA